MSFALIFCVIVNEIKTFAGDVADVVDVAKLARLRVNEDVAFKNLLVVGNDERRRFGLAEECIDERFNDAVIAHGHEDIWFEFGGSLKILVEHDF